MKDIEDIEDMIKEVERAEKEMMKLDAKEEFLLRDLKEANLVSLEDAVDYLEKEKSKNKKLRNKLNKEKEELMNEWF